MLLKDLSCIVAFWAQVYNSQPFSLDLFRLFVPAESADVFSISLLAAIPDSHLGAVGVVLHL